MALSSLLIKTYSSIDFVESAGAVLFNLATKRICLLHYHSRDEWVLPKGTRNVGETYQSAALREAKEDTGYTCRLLPVTMVTRAPPVVEMGHTPDVLKMYVDVTEPFMMTISYLDGEKQTLKIVTWYIAEIVEGKSVDGEKQHRAEWLRFQGAADNPTFKTDREVAQRAIEIVEATYAT